jgi:hypothetical protein
MYLIVSTSLMVKGCLFTLSTMESFSRRDLSKPAWLVLLELSVCISPAVSVSILEADNHRRKWQERLTVGTGGEALLGLVHGRLGGVGGDLLLGTVGERLAESVRHVEGVV